MFVLLRYDLPPLFAGEGWGGVLPANPGFASAALCSIEAT